MRHRRTILKVLCLLAAAAAVNVAVTWGLAGLRSTSFMTRSLIEPDEYGGFVAFDQLWMACAWSRAGVDELQWSSCQSVDSAVAGAQAEVISNERAIKDWLKVSIARYKAQWQHDPQLILTPPQWGTFAGNTAPIAVFGFDLAFGFPVRSMWYRSRYENDLVDYEVDDAWIFPANLSPLYHTGHRAIPKRVLWPGFVINTLFYAGVLWVLCCGPFALRRMIRRRRGQCAHCAYPIGQSLVCSECGAAVMPAKAGIQ